MEFSAWLGEWGWTIFAIPMGLICLVFFFVAISAANDKANAEKKQREEKERLQRLLVSETEVTGYTPSKIISGLISVDYQNQKWRPEFFENCKTFGFDEIAKFELIQNDVVTSSTTTTTQGGISRALAGGLIAGDVGALVGASTARTRSNTVSKKDITSRIIRISLTNQEINHIIINVPIKMTKHSALIGNYLDNYETDMVVVGAESYKLTSEQAAQEIISLLESITEIAVRKFNSENCANNAIEEIKKYKELLDSGIITEEEFTKKKQQLMNI